MFSHPFNSIESSMGDSISLIDIINAEEISLDCPGQYFIGDMLVEVIDGVDDYISLMQRIFDLNKINEAQSAGLCQREMVGERTATDQVRSLSIAGRGPSSAPDKMSLRRINSKGITPRARS